MKSKTIEPYDFFLFDDSLIAAGLETGVLSAHLLLCFEAESPAQAFICSPYCRISMVLYSTAVLTWLLHR